MERLKALDHLRMLLAVGEESEAARFVQHMVVDEQDVDSLLVPVAATLFERDHSDLALELANEAISRHEGCGAAHQLRVDALADLDDIEGAVVAAEAWVGADPANPDALVALSWVRLAVYDDDGAARAAGQARDLDPDEACGWLALAYVSRLGADWETLLVYSREAMAREPENVDARLFLGESLLATGQVDEATTLLRTVDDPRARAALRGHAMATGSAGLAVVLALLVALLGVTRGSILLTVVPLLTVAWFGHRLALLLPVRRRRRWRPLFGHPVVLWGGLAVAVTVLVRTLV